MTEKEKMLQGMTYNAMHDQELLDLRAKCKALCQKYNGLPINDENGRKSLMKEILGKTPDNFEIMPTFWCDYGFNIEIGEDFFANHDVVILDPAKVVFGNNVFVGPQCGFHTASHPIDAQKRKEGYETAQPITVGNDVWFGAGVQVMPGVTIGDNVVIGGGSVVVKDIPSNSIAVGNPCKVIRSL